MTDDGTLTFSGEGAIPNYSLVQRPDWHDYRDQIKKVVIESGVTDVGNNAFNGYIAIAELELPDTLTAIRNNTFYGCTDLSYVEYWGTTEPTIGNGVFKYCDNLSVVNVTSNYEGDSFATVFGVSKTLVPAAACDHASHTKDGCSCGMTDSSLHTSYTNGFCTVCDAYEEPKTEVDADDDKAYYLIDNAGKLYWFADKVNSDNDNYGNANAKLTANIVVNTGDVSGCDGTKGEGWRDWTPIGANPFYKGIFNGQSKTASGLCYSNVSTPYVGLFGGVSLRGIVENVGVINSYFSGLQHVGGVAGYNSGTVQNCYFNSEAYIGAAIGIDNKGTATNVESKTTAQFATGEVAYLLNSSVADGSQAFYQTIGTGTPTFSGDTVYYRAECDGVTMVYSNSAIPVTHSASLTAAEYYNTDGTCKACGAQAATSLTDGTTVTYYSTFEEAITAAQAADDSTITLLADCKPSGAPSFNIRSGKFTIDLNGKILSIDGANTVLMVQGGNITLFEDDPSPREITRSVDVYGGTLTINGGNYQKSVAVRDGNPIVENGIFVQAYTKQLGSITAKGGFFNKLEIYSGSRTLADTLLDDYYLYNIFDSVINVDEIKAVNSFYSAYNVTAKRGADLSKNATVETNGEYTYDGTEHIPDVTVTVGGHTLTKDTDYTVSYQRNCLTTTDFTSAGTVTVVVEGDGTVYKNRATATYTIKKAELKVVANAHTVTYGDAPASNGVFYEGFVNSENEEALNGNLTFTYNYAQYDGVGAYEITPSGLTSNNYDITFVAGDLTVSPKTITVKADAKVKTYGDSDPALTYSVEGILGSDTLSGALAREAGENVGVYGITLGTLANANYSITFVGESLTVSTKSVKVKADTKSVEQYTNLPELTYTVEGLLNEDSLVTEPALSLEITDTKAYGEYEIKISGAEASENYEITYEGAILTVTEHTNHRGGNATCSFGATCALCMKTYGSARGHSYYTAWKADAYGHWHECFCGANGGSVAHTPGAAATVTTNQICTVCSYVIAEKTGKDVELPEDNESNVDVNITVDEEKVYIEEISPEEIDKLIDESENKLTVEIDLTDTGEEVLVAVIPINTIQQTLDKADAAEVEEEAIKLQLPAGTVEFNGATLKAIVEQTEATDIELVLESVGTARLTDVQHGALGNLRVVGGYEAYLYCNVTEKRISDFKGGVASFSVPFAIPEGFTSDEIFVWHIADDGTAEKLYTWYEDGTLHWDVSHFSDFIVAAENVADPTPEPTPDPSPDPEEPVRSPLVWIIPMVVAVLGGGGFAVYWFVFRKRESVNKES